MTHTTTHIDYMKEIRSYILDNIKDKEDVYGCDLQNELFNTDYYIIGTYRAEQWLINGPGVFNAINEIQEYEQDNFDKVSTDFSSPEMIVNMFVYIMGEKILGESKTLINHSWNIPLDDWAINRIIEELQ